MKRRFLINFHFNNLHLIPATAIGIIGVHPAFTTRLAFCFKKLCGCQPVHAIMKVHYYSTSHCEVRNEYYGCNYLFHERGKDNMKSAKIVVSMTS